MCRGSGLGSNVVELIVFPSLSCFPQRLLAADSQRYETTDAHVEPKPPATSLSAALSPAKRVKTWRDSQGMPPPAAASQPRPAAAAAAAVVASAPQAEVRELPLWLPGRTVGTAPERRSSAGGMLGRRGSSSGKRHWLLLQDLRLGWEVDVYVLVSSTVCTQRL